MSRLFILYLKYNLIHTWWRGRPTMDGNTALGASSPAKPALHMPEPLSTTKAATSSSHMLDTWFYFLKFQVKATRAQREVSRIGFLGHCFYTLTIVSILGSKPTTSCRPNLVRKQKILKVKHVVVIQCQVNLLFRPNMDMYFEYWLELLFPYNHILKKFFDTLCIVILIKISITFGIQAQSSDLWRGCDHKIILTCSLFVTINNFRRDCVIFQHRAFLKSWSWPKIL